MTYNPGADVGGAKFGGAFVNFGDAGVEVVATDGE